jgi:uncharacterized protein YjbI with pentapeptide repeats
MLFSLGAKLREANLVGADLGGANLQGVDLTKANLSYANVQGADLTGATLTGAILDEADVRAAKVTEEQWQMVVSAKNMKRFGGASLHLSRDCREGFHSSQQVPLSTNMEVCPAWGG